MKRLQLPNWLTLVSAALIVLSFPPYDFAPLIWVALIPWFFALTRTTTAGQAALQGLWLGFFMSLLGFPWVASVLHEFGKLPWVLSILGLLLFGLIAQPQFVLTGLLVRHIQNSFTPKSQIGFLGAALIGSLGLAYAGLDWVIPKLFADTAGHALYSAPRLRQIADLGGAHLITVLVFITNYALFTLISRLRAKKEPSFWPTIGACAPLLVLPLVLGIGATVYGHLRLKAVQHATANPTAYLQAGVIQGNIGDIEKLAAESGLREAAEKVVGTMLRLSHQALELTPKPDVLIWPETSYPSTFRTPETPEELSRDLRLERFVSERNIPLLFGGYDFDGLKDYNSFFFLTPSTLALASPGEGNHLQIYHKNVLLMFGEYIPGMDTIAWLRQTFPQIGNFGRGPGPEVLAIRTHNPKMPSLQVGPIICYEALFPNFIIEAARKGSQMILNITNDSWFGTWGEPQLHLALSTFRSIESRLPQLRSTNTGISALILPTGEVVQRTAIGVPEVLNAAVPIIEPIPTLMLKWGDWFGWFAFCAGGLGLLTLSPWLQAIRRSRR